MKNSIIMYLIVNNLLLIHFIGIEDIKIKDHKTLLKRYLIITLTSLLIYSSLFYIYKLFLEYNLLFITPIIYITIIYVLTIILKTLNNILIIYNNKSKYSNDFLLSNSSLIAITFFALDKSHSFLEGIKILLLSSLSVLIALILITLTKKNFEKRLTSKILTNETVYFFIMFILSIIPNIIMLINNNEGLQ
ncbi:hypothetical protein F9Y90_03870 [Borrelia miyamotoi]|uniref:Uncharacterized protein n=1 Tax=Borrelia miyamotoi TaxID=47466 RepID=A0AAX3JNP0_9SPIR|nr:hypothetical protein [Borrelia miyamotoi]QFP42221.1 hypothetical protein F9Y90_03870 [Borrelia miyamotoi]QFP48335.1 hypothetical protein F9Y91_03865 [Borrelia miyamotoi]WAZ72141.1 hypothetical protein O5404_03935 [Borrelia miyamotoi]